MVCLGAADFSMIWLLDVGRRAYGDTLSLS